MLSGRIEQWVFVHPDSHIICSNIEIQLLNNNCLNIRKAIKNATDKNIIFFLYIAK